MNSHATTCGLILSALVACGGASAAPAPGANTSGLTLAISKLALNQKQVTIQFTLIKNNGKGNAGKVELHTLRGASLRLVAGLRRHSYDQRDHKREGVFVAHRR